MISFGPIPSRRLGKSLGINNIVAPKVCSYGCVYCQVGATVKKSIKRESFFNPQFIYEKVVRHIQQLGKDNNPDYLTFVSNGEPTLDVNLGKAISLLKKIGIPIAVITNSSLLDKKSVRDDLYLADWVSLKMDTADKGIWQAVNRPDPCLNFENLLKSINLFKDAYKGILCTETMLIDGLNDSALNVSALSLLVKDINPSKAFLSIPTRPPTVKSIKTPDAEKLNLAWHIFNRMHIKAELLTGFEGTDAGFTGNIYEDILNITAVHPLREDTLLKLLQNDKADFQVVEDLMKQRLIRSTNYDGYKYYMREYHIHI